MKSYHSSISKLISILQIVVGVITLGGVIYSIRFYYNFGKEHIDNFEKYYSIIKVIVGYHFKLFLGVTMVLGGFLYLKKKKIGYALSIGTLFLSAILHIQAIYISIINNGDSSIFNKSLKNNLLIIFLIFIILLSLLFLLMPIYLLKNPIDNSLTLTNKEKIILFSSVMLCLLDHFLSSF